MPQKNCKNCKEEFSKNPSSSYKKWEGREFCSRECWMDFKGHEQHGKSAGTKTKCEYCGEEFVRNRNKQKYCSISHANKHQYQTGQRDKTGIKKTHEKRREQGLEKFEEKPTTRISKRGYRLIYIPVGFAEKQEELEDGWMKMHHYVWWKEKGELPNVVNWEEDKEGMVIHHKDGDKLNNDIENLELVKNSEHISMHMSD